MNVMDSSGWLEYFADTDRAGLFAEVIEASNELIVPVITIYEVFKKVASEESEEAGMAAVAYMQKGHLAGVTESLAIEAARLSIEHRMPMADSMILATARLNDAVLWTQDVDFSGIEGVKFFPKD